MALGLGIKLHMLGTATIGMMLILLLMITTAAVNIINTQVVTQTLKSYHVVKIPGAILFPGWLTLAVQVMLILPVHLGDRDPAMNLWPTTLITRPVN